MTKTSDGGADHPAKIIAGNPFTNRMRKLTPLAANELAAIAGACDEVRIVAAHRDFVREIETPNRIHILLQGWAGRTKALDDGRRQMTSILLPGDPCDLDGLFVGRYDYSVTALTSVKLGSMTVAAAQDLIERYPAIGRAFTWLAFVDNSIMTEWLLSMGRRTVGERLAHLLCELNHRMTPIGAPPAETVTLPLTQQQLSEALGSTSVHVNRVLQQLRAERLVSVDRRLLTVHDRRGLMALAQFQPNYLHLDGMRAHAPA